VATVLDEPPRLAPVLARPEPRATTAHPKRRRNAAPGPATAAVRRAGSVRLAALALLGVVVACQPWWWNVGDLRGRTAAAAASTVGAEVPADVHAQPR